MMEKHATITRLVHDRRGNVAILSGIAMTMMIGAAALAVDVGSIYLDRRKLQGIADAAALAAAARPGEARVAALKIINANCDCWISIGELVIGSYSPDLKISPEQRFQPGASDVDAVKITLKRRHPLFFDRFLTKRGHQDIAASAIGARQGYTAFSMGSRVASVKGGVSNAILSGLTGSELNLSAIDYETLVGADVDLFTFSDALRTSIDADALTYGQTLQSEVTLPQALAALAASTSGDAATIVENMADRARDTKIVPANSIDLGPRSHSASINTTEPINVDVMTLLRAILVLGSKDRLIDLGLTSELPGGSSVRVKLAVGNAMQHSPLIAISNDQKIVLRSAQVRLLFDTILASPLATVQVPIIVEMGSAAARITDIDCKATEDISAVTLGVTTSPATFGIGTVDLSEFQDMSRPLRLSRARLIALPLVSIDGEAEVVLSDLNEKSVEFSRNEIADHVLKTVSSSGLIQGIATSLADRLTLTANVAGLGIGVPTGPLKTTTNEVLAAAAPVLDGVIEQPLMTLGVHLGQADTRINALRCGKAVLVG